MLRAIVANLIGKKRAEEGPDVDEGTLAKVTSQHPPQPPKDRSRDRGAIFRRRALLKP